MNAAGILHHPTVFHIWKLELTGFGLAILASFVIAQYVCQREFWRRGQLREAEAMPDITMAALAGTLIGAKTYYVILTGDPTGFFSRGGFVFWGGLMGGVLLCYLTILRKKISFARMADVCGIGIAAGYAVGRTGCWAVGDDYGHPWSGPFAVRFPEGAPPSTALTMMQEYGAHLPAGTAPTDVIAVHPTQLYEVAMGTLMFLVLWRFRTHKHAAGWLFGMYCLVAGIERFIVEFFRAKNDRFFFGLTSAQVIAVLVGMAGLIVMWRRSRSDAATPSLETT